MRTLLKLTSIAIMAALFLASCSKDDNGDGEPFSQKSVEENKQVVENSAIEMATTMDEMKDLQAADAAVNLGNLFDTADPLDSKVKKSSKVSATLNAIAGLGDGSSTPKDIFRVMKSPGELEEDPETLEDIWNEVVGIYSWNAEMMKWDYEAADDQVVFKFPSTEGGQTNDAMLTISDYQSVLILTPLEGDYDGDLPTSLSMDLKVGDTEIITYDFTASYNDDGIPTMVSSTLAIETFTFSVNFSSSNTDVSISYKLMEGEETIMEISGAAQGDFTDANIEKNEESDSPEEIVHSANATWQLFDIALKGDVNIRTMVKEMDAVYPEGYYNDPNFDYKAAAQQEADAINKNLNLRALNVEAQEKIAEVEAYVVEERYGDDYYDYWVDLQLKFGDGSLVDFETYFDQGFEEVVGDINEMIRDLNAEYEWDLEEIDYGK